MPREDVPEPTLEDEPVLAELEEPRVAPSASERRWAMFCHLTGLIGGQLFGLGPFLCALLKKDRSKFVDHHSSESLNFQMSLMAYGMPFALLAFGLSAAGIDVFVSLIPLLGFVLCGYALMILAGIQAKAGHYYRYPATLRFL